MPNNLILKLTATEIRKKLFNNEKLYASIGCYVMTNSQARRHLFYMDSDKTFDVIDNGTHLLIY